MAEITHSYDFGGAHFDLDDDQDREILGFILSQALYGEATGVYCGKSVFAARSLEAAHFYVRQAKQELNHLTLFADILKKLKIAPKPGHWVIRLMASHNNYYPLKVLMEHAIGEGMVLDIFRDVLLQTLPDGDPRMPLIKKKLRVVCKEEEEHVAWGEKQTKICLKAKPWLRWPYYGLVEIQLMIVPLLVRAFRGKHANHPVLSHLDDFVDHVQKRVWKQGQTLGFIPENRPGFLSRAFAMFTGVLLYVLSQFARSTSTIDKSYLQELGF